MRMAVLGTRTGNALRGAAKAAVAIVVIGGGAAAPARAQAPDSCTRNAVQFDVCAQAEKVKAAFATEFDGKRVGGGVYRGLEVQDASLIYVVAWPLPAGEITKLVEAPGQVREPLRGQLTKLATDTVCKDPQSAAMTRLGARYTYRFILPDGRLLGDAEIPGCPAP